MKRLILVLATAALVAMVPAATAGSTPVSSQATSASVHVINACLGGTACGTSTGAAIDVWMGTTEIVTDLAFAGGTDITIPAGTANYVVCTAGSTNNACAGSTLQIPSTPVTFVGGTNVTSIIGPGPDEQSFTNDISPTDFGKARFTLNNDSTLTLNVCVNGVQVLTAIPGTAGGHGETEFAQAVNAALVVTPLANCVGPVSTIPGFAAGTNFVLTVPSIPPTDTQCTTGCAQVIQVGQARPANSADLATFCPALVGLQGIQAEIKSVLGGIDVDNPATFPNDDAVRALVNDINAKVQAGDTEVPATVLPQWETATSGLRQLSEGLTSAGYVLKNIPTDQLRKIKDGANGVNQAPNPTLDAATTVLTSFFTANCVTAVTPLFTG